jgi:hypothetical protein
MPEPQQRSSSLDPVSASATSPIVAEVVRFEELPLGSRGSRRAVVRWSDGTTGEALRWYADLWGHPHKPGYVERRVMPRMGHDRARAAEISRNGSA